MDHTYHHDLSSRISDWSLVRNLGVPWWDTGFINPLAADYCVVGGSIPPIPTNTYVWILDLLRCTPTYTLVNANFPSNSTGPFLTKCWAPTVRITITSDGGEHCRQNLTSSLQPPPDQFGYHGWRRGRNPYGFPPLAN